MEKILLLFFILLKITLVVSQTNLEKDLIVYYPFDGNTIDNSGNGFHTISFATLTDDRFGNEDAAYHFNGIDEYIDLPNIDELKPDLPVTISFWVYFDDLEVTKTFMFTTDFEQDINSGVNMSLTSPKSSFAVAYGDGGSPSINSRRTKVANSEIKENTWYFIVTTVVSAFDMDIYISEFGSDSVCVNDSGDYSGNGSDLAYTDKPGSIGRKDAHTSKDAYYFMGRIDEFKMWSRALTVEEINILCDSQTVLSIAYKNKLNAKIFYQRTFERIKLVNLSGNLEIYNILGVKVKSKDNIIDNINVSDLKSGMYFVHLRTNDGETINYKFIK